MTTDDRLRSAVHQLDGDVDLYEAYRQFRRLEQTYAQQTSSPETLAALTAAATAAVDGDTRGAAGAHSIHRARLRRALPPEFDQPETAPSPPDRTWSDIDVDTVATAAGAGDQGAVEELLHRVYPWIEQYCRAQAPAGLIGPGYDRGDIVQEILLAVLTGLPERAGRPMIAFTRHVARRIIRDRPLPRVVPGLPDLDAHLRDLPSELREVLVLRVLLGMSAEEAADLLDTTPRAVRVRQHRALTRLRLLARGSTDGVDEPPAR